MKVACLPALHGIVNALFVLLTPDIIHLPWQLIPNPCLGCCLKIQVLCWLPLDDWRGWSSIPPQSGHRREAMALAHTLRRGTR